MSALPLDRAIKLYQTLSYFLPEDVVEGITVGEFIGKILDNIQVTHNHKVYLDALAIMQDTTIDKIMELYAPEESVNQFILGLQENQILALKSFCEKAGL